jgi:hypothetical protein
MAVKHDGYARYYFDGVEYKKQGWFGCQLVSYEWLRQPAGKVRHLNFSTCYAEVYLQTTKRKGLKIEHTWGVSSRGTLNEHKTRIEQLYAEIAKL